MYIYIYIKFKSIILKLKLIEKDVKIFYRKIDVFCIEYLTLFICCVTI